MIALLLILILCVLLFGAGAVLAGFGWLAVIVVALTLLYFLIIAAEGIFVSVRNLAPKAPGAVAALPGRWRRSFGAMPKSSVRQTWLPWLLAVRLRATSAR